ncbi:MAG: UDP-N-acetylmuramate--L-alanine ligase [Coriobacteriales bacterium]|jgi:UDP-N-acetylmuramate--alanine ligase|nr:UDP-N-acetylmuramate--L-alanine ligase [Coriobacteriales bacterium]
MFEDSKDVQDAKEDGLPRIRKVHFIGIGGAGMSGIALVAHERGLEVTGSDLKESRYMRSLLRANVQVTVGHDAANVCDRALDVVVVSSAVPEKNPEYRAAVEQGIEIWPRARMLAYLSRGHETLAVAGTHGKTTTSSVLATSLARLGTDPTFLIGGVVDGYDSTARVGKGKFIVVEADESDGSFTWLDPTLAIVTNIEADHLDHYESLSDIQSAFDSFLKKLAPEGTLIVWNGSPELVELANDLATNSGRNVFTYGIEGTPSVRCEPQGVHDFSVVFADGQRCALHLEASPGTHNMLNATAVMAALDSLGFNRDEAAAAVSAFSGVRRRFDLIGQADEVTVIDDYGHHPTEIAATLKAASELGYRKVHVLFQPHRYTRTRALLDEFARAFDHADTINFMDIYAAGEAPIPGVNSEALLDAVLAHNPEAKVRTIKHRTDVFEAMQALAEPKDLIITMGAGDVTVLAPLILEALERRKRARRKSGDKA